MRGSIEAIFLAGGGSPEIYFRIRNWRGFGDYRLQGSRDSFESLFRDLFFEFDQKSGAVIRLTDSNIGDRSLRIYYGEDEPYTLQLKGGAAMAETSTFSIQPLHFKWKAKEKIVDTKVYIEENQLKISGAQEVYPIHLISPLTVNSAFSAQRFSELSKSNRHQQVTEAVRELFPAVREITTEAIGGDIMLYAALDGINDKIPVAVLSGGMNKYLALILSIFSNRGGVVLVDEIENGFYYKFQTPMLRSIVKFCEQENVQLIASTHSYELLQSLIPVVEEADREETFSLLRVFRDGNRSEVKYIRGSSYKAALEQGFEVR